MIALPQLGLGTYKLTGDAGRDAVADALRIGYRHLDTATLYGNEVEVGQGLRASGVPRRDVFLTTKVWHTDLAPDALRASAEASLQRLGVDDVDLLLVHWPSPDLDLDATMAALVRAKDDGLAQHIGVSNFPPRLFERACALAPVSCVQVEYHVYLNQDDLLARARKHDAWLTAYRPVNKGAVDDEPVLRAIAANHKATPAQIALAWLLGQGGVAAIPKAASPENRRANFATQNIRLTPDEAAAIHALTFQNRRSVSLDWVDWENG